jgi:GTP-binding protein
LEKTFRRVLDLHGTPIRIEYRNNENPYTERKSKMTQRQLVEMRRKAERDKNRSKPK